MDDSEILNKEKLCPKCKEIKNLSEFPRYKKSSDGFYSYCKKCNNNKNLAWYVKNNEVILQKLRENRIKNNEEITKRQRDYYANNRERCLKTAKKSRDRNKEKINKRRREELRNNPERRLQKSMECKRWNEKNRDTIKETRKKRYEENKAIIRAKAKEKYKTLTKNEKEKINAQHRAWYKKNKDKLNKKLKETRNSNIIKKININIGASLRHSLQENKAGRHWEGLLGYTVYDLKEHLENLFTRDMNWEYFLSGDIHIDHKIPLVAFNYKSTDDKDFKKAWSLDNLQPLWAEDNIRKGSKILYPELHKELIC